ncbi:ATPase, T2SS/T4P/T4SS family [Azospirillum canadense]|uniref:ATPase, T2SS/T4P/T4SS family n=1 Tax=Azospirillum canadense TaxID=403962 RepID=UPI002227F76E|nr:ATPase, T2SS/T4P/T4SS family [Azospirillum canadense]MCW2240360.1 hypothetical protein [Azospirillum canadense]
MFTDIDLFLHPATGDHDLPPRVKRRDGSTRLLTQEEALSPSHADAPLPDFPHLVAAIWHHYHGTVAGPCHPPVPAAAGAPPPPSHTDLTGGPAARPPSRPPALPPHPGALHAVPLPASPPALLRAAPSQSDWGTVWHAIPLRITYQATFRHLHVAISRGLWPIPALDDLGYDPAFIARLRLALTSPGLQIYLGKVGAGKTTLIWSALIDTVTRQNSKGIVLEDVNEIPAEGIYGQSGAIIQVQVPNNDYAPHVRHALRLRAQQLVINEVRSATTASELLHAAGRVPIMTTAQGLDIEQGIAALRDLASAAETGPWAGTALANALVAAIHIKGVRRRPDGQGYFIDVDALFTDGEERDAIRGIIRHGDLHHLRDHIQRQAASRWSLPRPDPRATITAFPPAAPRFAPPSAPHAPPVAPDLHPASAATPNRPPVIGLRR